MAYNYATFLCNFLDIICIKAHMDISARRAALLRPFDQLHQVPWHFLECVWASVVRRLSESVNEMDHIQSLCGCVWLWQRITGCAERHLGFMAQKAASFLQGYWTLHLVCFFLNPVKTEEMMLDVCAVHLLCYHWRPKSTLPSSGHDAAQQQRDLCWTLEPEFIKKSPDIALIPNKMKSNDASCRQLIWQ